jgi:hypothetical protein
MTRVKKKKLKPHKEVAVHGTYFSHSALLLDFSFRMPVIKVQVGEILGREMGYFGQF